MALPSPTEPEGPIIDIFKSLMKTETPRSIVLTNSHLNKILQKEFYMDTGNMQKYEVEMYVKVLKRYLKDWPEWDTFGKDMDKLKQMKDDQEITKVLKKKYEEIKDYLSGMLYIAQVLASDKVEELNRLKEKARGVVMEVEGNTPQFRNLFCRYPLNSNIFNVYTASPSVLMCKKSTFESIVNWFGVEIEMAACTNNKIFVYKRQNLHKLTHRLLNVKLKGQEPCQPVLKKSILVKSKGRCNEVSRDDLMKHLKRSLKSDQNIKWHSVSRALEMIIDDLMHLPESIDVSCDYRRHISERKYVRYFISGSLEGDETDKCDLQLEEVVSPLCEYSFKVTDNIDNGHTVSLTLSCKHCERTFKGPNCVVDIVRHFSVIHMAEPDWECLKCSKVFTMCSLAQTFWNHPCK